MLAIIFVVILLALIIWMLYQDDDTTPWRTTRDSLAIHVVKILVFLALLLVIIPVIGSFLFRLLIDKICPCPCL